LLDPNRARMEISRAPVCAEERSLQKALVRSELYRFGHREEDARLARESIAALRAGPAIPIGEQALLAHIEGNLLIDVDRAAGRRALREAISKAGHQADDFSVKARAY